MSARVAFRAALVVGVFLVLTPREAHAKIILITHGDTISDLGGQPVRGEQGMPGFLRVGHKSSYFGVFWLDLWTWGGEFCLYEGKTYFPIPRAQAAQILGKPESEVQEPFLYRFPLGLMIVVALVVVCVPMSIVGSIKKNRQQTEAEALLQDPRYTKALEAITAAATPNVPAEQAAPAEAGPNPAAPTEAKKEADSGNAFEAGVRVLTDTGVERDEAIRNLAKLISYKVEKL